jgi:hypothetical protein
VLALIITCTPITDKTGQATGGRLLAEKSRRAASVLRPFRAVAAGNSNI